MSYDSEPAKLEREKRLSAISTYGDLLKVIAVPAIMGVFAVVGMYYQFNGMKEAQAADRAQQALTLSRIENKVERIDDSVRTIELKVTSMDADAKGTERRLSHLERR